MFEVNVLPLEPQRLASATSKDGTDQNRIICAYGDIAVFHTDDRSPYLYALRDQFPRALFQLRQLFLRKPVNAFPSLFPFLPLGNFLLNLVPVDPYAKEDILFGGVWRRQNNDLALADL